MTNGPHGPHASSWVRRVRADELRGMTRRHARVRVGLRVRVMVRSVVWVGVAVAFSACASLTTTRGTSAPAAPKVAEQVRVPRNASRFEIDMVDDSTARFKIWEAEWVRAGLVAHVVDPLQRDALVASVRVTSVVNGTAVALVTSQVTRVRTENVVLLSPPPIPLWKQRRFWIGALIGGTVGGVLGAHRVF